MQNSDPTSRSVLIQTTLRVAENEDEELLIVSDRGCQTVASFPPDVLNANIVPLLEYTPYSEIVVNSLRIYDLPRKYQLQFDLSGHHQRSKHQSVEGNVKSALKKNPSDIEEPSLEDEEGDEEIFYIQQTVSAQLEAMRKSKTDEDIQTDLTVIPPVLDDDGIANVCTQLGVQTSITFTPDASLSRVTPDLKTPMNHANEYQAIMINGKFVKNYDANKPKKDEEETEEDTESTEVPTDTEDLTMTEDTSGAEEGSQAVENPPNTTQYSMAMTEEEFEKNVQRILEKTVANVYDFMAKIVEIYEQSKEALADVDKPEGESEGEDDQAIKEKKPKLRSPSAILNDRQKAFKYLEEINVGVIHPNQVEVVELPDNSKLYRITLDEAKVKVFEASVAKKMDDPTRVLKVNMTEKNREPKAVAEPTDEQVDDVPEQPDMERIGQMLAQIHANAMDPDKYVVIDNADGTKSFIVQDNGDELEILEVADLYASDSELTDGADEATHLAAPTTDEEPVSTEEASQPTEPNELTEEDETTEPLVEGEEAGQPTGAEATEPTGEVAVEAAGDEGDLIGDSTRPHKGPEIQCECCIVKESGNAPPCLHELENENVLTFELNIPTGSTVEKTFDGIKVKANISRPDQLKTEQIITVSVNVAGTEAADDSCSCPGDRATDKCEDCESGKRKKSPKCDCPDDEEEDKPKEQEKSSKDEEICDCEQDQKPQRQPSPERAVVCICPRDEPPPLCLCDNENEGPSDHVTEAVSSICSCANESPKRKPKRGHSAYDSDSIIGTCSCGNVTSVPKVSHKLEETEKPHDEACDNICAKNATVSTACGPDVHAKKKPVRISEELCKCIRKDLTQSEPPRRGRCKCSGVSSGAKSHSCSCMDKEDYIEPENICSCNRKPPSRPKTISTPKVCECDVNNVMNQLRQKTSCVKDSKMVDMHMNTLKPLLQKIGTGDSKPDARVSSVQVIYKKPDAKKSDKMCACDIKDGAGAAPPVTPMVNAKTKSCNCDLGVAENLTPLYQEEDEYNEAYLDDMFENIGEGGKSKCVCSSLPEVVTSTDKCGSRTEVPWMKIALPPPGTFEIQKVPKKGCQCGKQVQKPKPAEGYGQAPVCKCREPKQTKPKSIEKGDYAPKKKPPPPKDPTPTRKDMTCPELCDLKESMKNPPKPIEEPVEVEAEQASELGDKTPTELKLERKCSCSKLVKGDNDCEDTMRPTKMIYNDDNTAYNEEYMNPLCKMFADATDDTGEGTCGPDTEINWDEITIPKKVRLKQCPARKKMPASYSENLSQTPSTKQSKQSSMQQRQPPITLLDMQKRSSKQSRVTEGSGIVQLELHFSGYTEVMSTIIPVAGGAQSQQTLTQISDISDLRMTLKRCPPDFVATTLDQVGSQPFMVIGGKTGSVPFDMPSPGIQSSLQFPEKDSALMGMINYETASTGPIPQKRTTKPKDSIKGRPSGSIRQKPSEPIRQKPSVSMKESFPKESVRGKQSICQPSDCSSKHETFKEPPKSSTCPPEDCQKQEVCECSPTTDINGSVATMTSAEFKEKYNIKSPVYTTEMFLEGKPMSMLTSTLQGTEPYDARIASRLAEMNLRLTAADSLFGVTCSCDKTEPPEPPPQKQQSKADCSCRKKSSKIKCVCTRTSRTRPPPKPSKQPKQPKKEPPCLCVEEALYKLKSPIITALETCEREMKPLHDTLNQLRSKVQSMDIPELNNWSAGTSLSSCYAAMYGNTKQQINFFVPETLGPFQQYSTNVQKMPKITSVSRYNDPMIQAYWSLDKRDNNMQMEQRGDALLRDKEEFKLENKPEQVNVSNYIDSTEASEIDQDPSKGKGEEKNKRGNKDGTKVTKAIQNNDHPKLCSHCYRALQKGKKGQQKECTHNEIVSTTENDDPSTEGRRTMAKEVQELIEESMGLGNLIKRKGTQQITTEELSPFKAAINTIRYMKKDIEKVVDESMALDKLHKEQKRTFGKLPVKSAKVTQSEFSISFCGLFTPVSSDTVSSIVSDGKQKKIKELLNLGFDSKHSLSASSGDQVVNTCYQAAAPMQSHSEILLGQQFSTPIEKNHSMPNNYPYMMDPYFPTPPGNYYPNMYNPYFFNYGPFCYSDFYNNPYQNANYSSYPPCKMEEDRKSKRSSSNASRSTSRSTTSVSSSGSTTNKSSRTSTSTQKTSKTSNSEYPSTKDCDETTDVVESLTDEAADEKRVEPVTKDTGESQTTSYTKESTSASKSQGRRKLVRITVKTTPSGNKIISKEEVFDSSTSTTYK